MASTSSARRPTAPRAWPRRASLRPDLVLLDIGLPDVEGFEVARALAADGPPPFVVLTSSRDASAYGPRLSSQPRARLHRRRTSCREPRSAPCRTTRDPPGRPRGRFPSSSARASPGCSWRPASRSSARRDARRACLPPSARTCPTSRSSTSGCRPPTPTRASGPRRRSGPSTARRSGSSCCRSTSRRRSPCDSWPTARVEWATCSRTGSRTSTTSPTPSAGSPRAVRSSIRRSSPSSSAGGARGSPLDDLTEREREVLALMAEGRSNQAICDRLLPRPEDGRGAHRQHLLEARAAAGAGRPPAGARGARPPPRLNHRAPRRG